MNLPPSTIQKLQSVLQKRTGLAFAVLVGSQVTGMAHAGSDWDIAIQWSPGQEGMDLLFETEQLRQDLRQALQVDEDKIDMIDLSTARLAMRELVSSEGLPLQINHELAWVRFLQNTWSQLEDHQWRQQHAP